MGLNKRGIMLTALVSILLAILIFVPTCLGISKYLRLSDQAVSNFKDFVSTLEKFSQSDRIADEFILILDEESFLTIFTSKEKSLIRGATTEVTATTTTPRAVTTTLETNYYFPYPEGRCTSLPCACLCREFEVGEKYNLGSKVDSNPGAASGSSGIDYACQRLTCLELKGLEVQSWSKYREKEGQRRIKLNLAKEGKKIILS